MLVNVDTFALSNKPTDIRIETVDCFYGVTMETAYKNNSSFLYSIYKYVSKMRILPWSFNSFWQSYYLHKSSTCIDKEQLQSNLE